MPVYNQFPRLYQQGQNPTTQYYGGLARPNPIGNSLGKQSIAKNGPAGTQPVQSGPLPIQSGPLPNQNSGYLITPWGRYNLQTGWAEFKNPDGTYTAATDAQTGAGSRRDPRIFGSVGMDPSLVTAIGSQAEPGSYNTRYWVERQHAADDSGNSPFYYESTPDYVKGLNGRVRLTQLGSGGYSEVKDPSRVTWDDEFGLVTDPDNIGETDMGPSWSRPRNLAMLTAAAIAGGIIAPELLAGLGASEVGVVGTAEQALASQTVAGGGVLGGSGGGAALGAGAGSLPLMSGTSLSAAGVPWSAGMLPAEGALYGTGAAATGAATAGLGGGGTGMQFGPITGSVPADIAGTTAATSGAFPWGQFAGNIAGFLGNRYLQGQNEGRYNSLMDRADPWGQENRARSQQMLWNLFNDPSSIENTPGYQFSRQQGEQGISRAAAQKGYFRSPNMLYDLSKFNQGLAQQTWDREVNRLMAMSGVQFDPSNAARIGAQGAQNSNNMNAAGITQLIGAGGNILDWLFGGNGGFV